MRTREEQIDSLYYGHNRYSTITQDAFRNHLIEAERRAERRVRAEIGRDSERLDWLGDDRHRLVSHASIGTYVTTESGETYVNDDIRLAIDAAREMV